jgi:hypothetical protein
VPVGFAQALGGPPQLLGLRFLLGDVFGKPDDLRRPAFASRSNTDSRQRSKR